MNQRTAQFCNACDEPLHRQREPRIVVTGRPLVRAIEAPMSPDVLRLMTYTQVMTWAGQDRARLEQVASARGYKRGWVYYTMQAQQAEKSS